MRFGLIGLALCGHFAFAQTIDCLSSLATDWSRSQEVKFGKLITPNNIHELSMAIRHSHLPVSIRGGGYSMGGQTMIPDGLLVDMRNLNRVMAFDPRHKLITVQAGATWAQVQDIVRRDNLAVKVMQSYNNFQVGGALSVNAHGRYVGYGPIISTVRAIKVMNADGDIVHADRVQNSDLFYGAIGGYGALGIIVEATLELTENINLERDAVEVAGSDVSMLVERTLKHFDSEVLYDGDSVMWNAVLYPPRYQTIRSVTFRRSEKPLTVTQPMHQAAANPAMQFAQSSLISLDQFSDWAKILREKVHTQTREQIAQQNWEASHDVRDLYSLSDRYPWLRRHIPGFDRKSLLQEYFIPRAKLPSFIASMKDIFLKHDVNVSNISLRHVPENRESIMSWSREESFAVVIYYTQEYGPNKDANLAKAALWTQEVIDAVLASGGTYYLPYQLYPTRDQFLRAYPRYTEFMDLKRKYDPQGRFTNSLWQSLKP